MRVPRFLYRMCYYFKIGYSTYLTFLLGCAATLVTVYYLGNKEYAVSFRCFSSFLTVCPCGFLVGVPFSVLIGWMHLKGTALWRAEMDTAVEANPYLYKVYPGTE